MPTNGLRYRAESHLVAKIGRHLTPRAPATLANVPDIRSAASRLRVSIQPSRKSGTTLVGRHDMG
jgi:hypothetical protein